MLDQRRKYLNRVNALIKLNENIQNEGALTADGHSL